MESKRDDTLIKMVTLGFSSVGKSSILRRISDDTFIEQTYNTIGTDLVQYNDPQSMKKYQMWEISGSEAYIKLSNSVFRNTKIFMIVFDVCEEGSLDRLKYWYDQIVEKVNLDILEKHTFEVILIGNKNDRKESRKIHQTAAEQYASNNGMMYIDYSAKDSTKDEMLSKINEALLKISIY